MRPGTYFEVYMRGGNAHLAEENVGKFLVVVLAGVHQDGFNLRMTLHLMHQRRDFRQVGPRSDDVQDFQA
jgi:hypothetical protein